MQPFSDEGLVLSRRDFGEADRILTVLTKYHGKVGVIVKGGRKATSKLTSGTDLFARAKMQLLPGKGDLLILTGTERVGTPPDAIPYEQLILLGAVCQVADALSDSGQPLGEPVFELVSLTLERIIQGAVPEKALLYYLDGILQKMGYGLQVLECVSCGGVILPKAAKIEIEEGGVLCENCQGSAGFPVSFLGLKILRLLARGDWKTYFSTNLPKETLLELLLLEGRAAKYHSNRGLSNLDQYLELAR